MNSYHKNHPDPEMRQKYKEWEEACFRSNAMSAQPPQEHDAEKERRKSVQAMLKAIGGQQVKGSKFTSSGVNKKQTRKRMHQMQKTGGQRGS